MNTQLQQLIEEMKDELSKATEDCQYWREDGDTPFYHGREYGRKKAFEKYIPKLEKILNEGSVAATPKDEPTEEQYKMWHDAQPE